MKRTAIGLFLLLGVTTSASGAGPVGRPCKLPLESNSQACEVGDDVWCGSAMCTEDAKENYLKLIRREVADCVKVVRALGYPRFDAFVARILDEEGHVETHTIGNSGQASFHFGKCLSESGDSDIEFPRGPKGRP